jgi:hypothetical protein
MPIALTDEQKTQLAGWVADGASLADVQKRLAAEFSISMTYMDARFLLDDLNLTIKEKAKPAAAADISKTSPADDAMPMAGPPGASPFPGPGEAAPASRVRVSVDKIVRPGAVVSGNVTFSDGQSADWHLDQAGRLSLAPKTKGYQPKPPDVQEFQYALQDELARLGY